MEFKKLRNEQLITTNKIVKKTRYINQMVRCALYITRAGIHSDSGQSIM